MTTQIDLFAAAPTLMKSWTGTSMAVASSLEPSLIELVKIRASQINGCANCLNMHTTEARSKGETEQRIYLLSAWREAPCYTDRERAALAHEIIDLAMEGEDLPIVFDLTLNGLGRTQNLLTLAFAPPFLAATLCLALAMIVVAWRAFRRFGPPLAEARAIAFGKRRLVANGAAFILRTRRLHLLTGPYIETMRQRLAAALRLRGSDDETLDRAISTRLPDAPGFAESAAALREAARPNEILRAASALKSLERKLIR